MLWTGLEVTEQPYTMIVHVVVACLEIHTIHVIFCTADGHKSWQ